MEGASEQQWRQLEGAAELIARAPEDEVAGEICALQAELLAQVAVNRRRVCALLEALVPDLPRQLANAEGRAASVEFITAHVLVGAGGHAYVAACMSTCLLRGAFA